MAKTKKTDNAEKAGVKVQTGLKIPVAITDEDKIKLLDEVVQNNSEIGELEEKLKTMKAKHKEDEAKVLEDIKKLSNENGEKLKVAKRGEIVKEKDVIIRKDFGKMPAMIEYLDPESKETLSTRPLTKKEFQVNIGEEIVGDPSQAKLEQLGNEDSLPV